MAHDSSLYITLKEKARALLSADGIDLDTVELYLSDDMGFRCLEPWNYPWESTKKNLIADYASYLKYREAAKTKFQYEEGKRDGEKAS